MPGKKGLTPNEENTMIISDKEDDPLPQSVEDLIRHMVREGELTGRLLVTGLRNAVIWKPTETS
jgi:hypothetical protein